jgi:hypothetical protein
MTTGEDPLAPLRGFYARAGLALPAIEACEPGEMPDGARALLAHDGDMTPTLESYHGEPLMLRVLDARLEGPSCFVREVVLLTRDTGRAVEFGAIRIHLDAFPSDARREVLACRRPLGGLLADHGIPHQSAPSLFFKLWADEVVRGALGLTGAPVLFGRCNTLRDPGGRTLAQVVEVLPPVGAAVGPGSEGPYPASVGQGVARLPAHPGSA